MGNLTEVKTTFTIDLAPYLEGLKSMLMMTQQTGVQLKPLLNLQIGKADFSQLEKTFQSYTDKIKASIPIAGDVAQASTAIGAAAVDEETKVRKTSQSHEEHSLTLRNVRRDSLQAFGAIAFLTQGIVTLASSNDQGNKKLEKLNQGLSQGISSGFGLAGILITLGVTTMGVGAAIGAAVAVGVTLLKFLDDGADKTAALERATKGFSNTLRGASLQSLEEYRANLSKVIAGIREKIRVDEEHMKTMGQDTVAGARTIDGLKQMQQALTNYTKISEAVNDEITAKQKTHAEWRDLIRTLELSNIVNNYDRQRAEAQKWYEDQFNELVRAAATTKAGNEIIVALKNELVKKLSEIDKAQQQDRIAHITLFNDQEKQIDDAQFEEKMSFVKISGMNLGVVQSEIDAQINVATLARKKSQLAVELSFTDQADEARKLKIANLLKDIAALQAQGEQAETTAEEQKNQHLQTLRAAATQKIVLLIQKRGVEQGRAEEQINVDVLNEKKKGVEGELKVLSDQEAQGKQLDLKQTERKAQLENELTDFKTQGVEARKKLIGEEYKKEMDSIKSISDDLNSAFSTIAQMEQQRTSKTIGEEKKRKEAALDTQKATLLAAAKTDVERQKIEQDFSDKKDALDAEMNDKAKAANQSAFEAQKAFAIVQALISTYSAAALALGPPPLGAGPIFGPFIAGAAIAAGLANVAMIESQEVPGLALGAKINRPTLAMVGEAGTEYVAPEKSFIQVFKDELGPRLIDVLLPQLKASILGAIAVSGSGGGGITIQIYIANYYGDEEHFDKVLKPAIEDAMRRAGVSNADALFKNPKRAA